RVTAIFSPVGDDVLVTFPQGAPSVDARLALGSPYVSDLEADDARAVLIDYLGKIAVYDLSGSAPVLAASFDEIGVRAEHASIDGDVLATSLPNDERVVFFDLGSAPTLEPIGEVSAPGAASIALGPGAAYAGGDGVIHVLPRP
ncbi:MAG: hypothetical protein H5U40_07970, partial [Polyangiaceae bacterium]|nr:hypothetical protein [Polyangiaceae bacterium]